MSRLVAGAGLLAEHWQLALRAERRSPQTLKALGDDVRSYLAWCAERDGELDAEPVTCGSPDLWVGGRSRGTRPPARRPPFSAWLTEEGELPADPFLGGKGSG